MKIKPIIDTNNQLNRIQCTKCQSLLFKAKSNSLQKSASIEIKCRKCATINNISL